MLVLTRHVGEEIVINDDIRITVLEIRGSQVALGVTAPATVRVGRRARDSEFEVERSRFRHRRVRNRMRREGARS